MIWMVITMAMNSAHLSPPAPSRDEITHGRDRAGEDHQDVPDGTVGVKDVDLRIADGEFIILVGPSGCKKSTALNMIAGLEDITSGDLLIGGERANERRRVSEISPWSSSLTPSTPT